MIKARFSNLGLSHLWIITVILGVFVFVNTQPIRPHDFWWHLALGREIASSYAIPGFDVYSHIMGGTAYPSYQMFWLFDLTLYGIFNLGGPALVVFVQSLMITTTYGLLLWLSWKCSNSTRIAAFSVLIAIALGLNNWNVRPQTISYLLGVLFLVAIYSFRISGKKSWLLVMPFGMLIWVNSHGSFVIGLAFIGIWVGEELWQMAVSRYCKINNKSKGNLWPSILSFGFTALVCLVNPRGYGIITYLRTLIGDVTVQNLVPEWAPPSFDDIYGILFFSSFILSAVVFAISPKRPSFFQLATFVVFGILGLKTTRGVVWFGIVMAPILAAHIAELLNTYIQRKDNRIEKKGKPAVNWLFIGILLLAVLVSLPWFKNKLPFPRNKAGLISSETPVKATEFLLAEQLPTEIFHEMGFGSYLIWAAYPDYQVFSDPRIELYPFETWWDYTAIGNALDGWENLLDEYGIQTLMISLDSQAPLVAALGESQGWILEYEDPAALIYTRKEH